MEKKKIFIKWMPGNYVESKDSRRNIDIITCRAPIGLKNKTVTVFPLRSTTWTKWSVTLCTWPMFKDIYFTLYCVMSLLYRTMTQTFHMCWPSATSYCFSFMDLNSPSFLNVIYLCGLFYSKTSLPLWSIHALSSLLQTKIKSLFVYESSYEYLYNDMSSSILD